MAAISKLGIIDEPTPFRFPILAAEIVVILLGITISAHVFCASCAVRVVLLCVHSPTYIVASVILLPVVG